MQGNVDEDDAREALFASSACLVDMDGDGVGAGTDMDSTLRPTTSSATSKGGRGNTSAVGISSRSCSMKRIV
jgi:hypothetical protein